MVLRVTLFTARYFRPEGGGFPRIPIHLCSSQMYSVANLIVSGKRVLNSSIGAHEMVDFEAMSMLILCIQLLFIYCTGESVIGLHITA